MRKEHKNGEMVDLAILKEFVGSQYRNRLHRAPRNGAWISTVPHHLNGTELYWEEFRDNLASDMG